MLPESKYIKHEIILREMELNDDVKLTKKSLLRWLALAMGLVNPNESRTQIIDIFEVLIYFSNLRKKVSVKEIDEELKKRNVQIDEKTIYYHLLKLKNAGILKKDREGYFIADEKSRISDVIKKNYEEKVSLALKNIEEAISYLER